MNKIESARKYAEDNGIITHYEQTGEVKKEYLDYLASLDKPNRGVGILHDNLNGSGTWVPLTGTGQPTYGSFNDRAESASGIGLANTIYDRTFWRTPARWLTLGTGGAFRI